VAKLRAAVAAIAADPSMAAKPEYSFLFAMGHMKASVMVDRSHWLGPTADFTTGTGPASAGMTGNQPDPGGPVKEAAYKAAYRLLEAKATAAPGTGTPGL
jgi:hypothetical protein